MGRFQKADGRQILLHDVDAVLFVFVHGNDLRDQALGFFQADHGFVAFVFHILDIYPQRYLQ